MWNAWSEETFMGIAVWRVLLFFTVVFVSLVIGRLVQYFMVRSGKRVKSDQKTLVFVVLEALARPVMFVACTVGWRLGVAALGDLSQGISDVIYTISAVMTTASIGYTLYKLVDIVDYYLANFARSTASKVDDMLVPLVGKSVRITVLVLVAIDVIQALSKKPVTSILAGLGVGGLAIALAGQDTIKNFFGSIVIVADKPFEIGDRVVVDGHDGPVESVGFRSTKIRTLNGHLVTVPNAEIMNKTVQNIGKRPYIKRVMNITVTYDTTPEKVQRAVDIISDILNGHEGMDPDSPPRVFFSDFNDWSLNILVIYWYYPPDYWAYMAFGSKVNMQILEQFNKEGIQFAFPTQTICMGNTD